MRRIVVVAVLIAALTVSAVAGAKGSHRRSARGAPSPVTSSGSTVLTADRDERPTVEQRRKKCRRKARRGRCKRTTSPKPPPGGGATSTALQAS